MNLKPGCTVIVKAYPNEQLERLVLAVQSPTVVLTTEEELKQAQLEKREPICIGFPMKDIVSTKD